uniref:Putative methyltransferase n=2 Tax=viral metagenome TaxID=1070528 RepID=A0A6M3IJJ2_9ZZZZ
MAEIEDVVALNFSQSVQFSMPDYRLTLAVPVVTLAALFAENYEVVEAQMARFMYADGDVNVVLEGGSGVGLVTMLIASCGVKAIHALEPQPMFFKTAVHNLEINGAAGVHMHRAALGVRDETADFSVRWLPYASALEGVPSKDIVRETIRVQVMDVNRAVAEFGANVLHLDIEGGEAEVLMGADLTPINKVVVEMHPHILGESTCSYIIHRLAEAGIEPCLVGNSDAFPNRCYVLGCAREPAASRIRAAGTDTRIINVITSWDFKKGERGGKAAADE